MPTTPIAPLLDESVPPLRQSLRDATPDLPRPLTTFVGREREVASVSALLRRSDVRLITLSGPGGVGKTRLALRVAERYEPADEGYLGIWFVPLASVRDPARVASAILHALPIRSHADQRHEYALVDFLSSGRSILILDNFEQVVAAGTLVADLLSACPQLTILVTSRTLLRVSGEHVVAISPMSIPDDDQAMTLDRISDYDSIRLFVDRAATASPTFALTWVNARAVLEICQRLDGLPLAIELAAARIRVLTPEALSSRLAVRLPILTDGPSDQPAWLQTMRNAIDWSYDLLSSNEQAMARRIAVFAGGFSLDTIEAMDASMAEPSFDEQSTLGEGERSSLPVSQVDLLTTLLDHSLIRRMERGDEHGSSHEPRFLTLETVREYLLDRLDEHGERDATCDTHAHACLALARRAEVHLLREVDSRWLDRLESEHDNLRAALTWSLNAEVALRSGHLGLRLAGALWLFWYYHSHIDEGRRWLEEALAVSDAGDDMARATAMVGLGTLVHAQGDEQHAQHLLDGALVILRSHQDSWSIAFALSVSGMLAEDGGRYDEASNLFAESNELFALAGDQVNVAVTLYHLGVAAFGQGDLPQAEARCFEALKLSRLSNDPWTSASVLSYLGLIHCALGRHEQAGQQLDEALTLFRRIGNTEHIAEALRRIAVLAAARANAGGALRLFAAAEALGERIGAVQALPERVTYERAIGAIRATLSPAEFARIWSEGRLLLPPEAIAEAYTHATVSNDPLEPEHVISPEAIAGLSAREVEVLRLLVQGHTDMEIASSLFISRRTASAHVGHIYEKLGVSSRAAAAAYAVRHGLD